MGWRGSEDYGSAVNVAEFVQRQLFEGYLTTNTGADIRRVERIGPVRGVQRDSNTPWFEIELASGQHFKVTIEEND